MYEYKATVTRVVDGDTLWLDLDLGCDTRLKMSVRLFGVNCPEMGTNEGRAAKAFVEAWVARVPYVVVKTEKDKREKYGRYLATLLPPLGERSLNRDLMVAGHAVEYLL